MQGMEVVLCGLPASFTCPGGPGRPASLTSRRGPAAAGGVTHRARRRLGQRRSQAGRGGGPPPGQPATYV
eukprot:scaffold228552_cov37-Prasinocladus_malaysianus.AAC.1